MSKFSKILTCSLAGILAIGGVGTACYYKIPSFQTQVKKVLKTNNKANIGIDNSKNDEGKSDNPSEVKPITPEEFKKIYKIELPASFLGDLIFVKNLKNNDLLISSSVSTSILYFNHIEETTKQVTLENKNWRYFEELENGDCVILSYDGGVPLLFKAETKEIIKFQNSLEAKKTKRIKLLKNGKVAVIDYNNLKILNLENMTVEVIGNIGSERTNIIERDNGDLILYYSNIYLYKLNSNDLFTVNIGNYLLEHSLDFNDNKVLFSSYYYSIIFDISTLTFKKLEDLKMSRPNLFYSTGNLYFFSDSGNGIYKFDTTDESFSKISSLYIRSGYENKVNVLKNGNILYYGDNFFVFNIVDFSVNLLGQFNYRDFRFFEFENGDLFIYPKTIQQASGDEGCYYFKVKDNTLTKLTGYISFSNEFPDAFILSNNRVILKREDNQIYLFKQEDLSFVKLLSLKEEVNLILQDDGTVFIETGEDINYEYNPETDTIKVVYQVVKED